jgi:hypothetical protein
VRYVRIITIVTTLLTRAPAYATARPAPPTHVTVTVVTGGVRVTWSKSAAATSYTVTAQPGGTVCTVKTLILKGTIAVSTLALLRYTVTTTTRAGATSAPSALSTTITPHMTLVIAGQSNAMGAESYAIDPTTGTNYFGPDYTNGGDTADRLFYSECYAQAPQSSYQNSLDTPQIWNSPLGVRQFFGPKIGLARTVYNDTHAPATITKVAYAATSLATNWNPASTTGLYAQIVELINSRLATDADAGQLDVVAGFYWY